MLQLIYRHDVGIRVCVSHALQFRDANIAVFDNTTYACAIRRRTLSVYCPVLYDVLVSFCRWCLVVVPKMRMATEISNLRR